MKKLRKYGVILEHFDALFVDNGLRNAAFDVVIEDLCVVRVFPDRNTKIMASSQFFAKVNSQLRYFGLQLSKNINGCNDENVRATLSFSRSDRDVDESDSSVCTEDTMAVAATCALPAGGGSGRGERGTLPHGPSSTFDLRTANYNNQYGNFDCVGSDGRRIKKRKRSHSHIEVERGFPFLPQSQQPQLSRRRKKERSRHILSPIRIFFRTFAIAYSVKAGAGTLLMILKRPAHLKSSAGRRVIITSLFHSVDSFRFAIFLATLLSSYRSYLLLFAFLRKLSERRGVWGTDVALIDSEEQEESASMGDSSLPLQPATQGVGSTEVVDVDIEFDNGTIMVVGGGERERRKSVFLQKSPWYHTTHRYLLRHLSIKPWRAFSVGHLYSWTRLPADTPLRSTRWLARSTWD